MTRSLVEHKDAWAPLVENKDAWTPPVKNKDVACHALVNIKDVVFVISLPFITLYTTCNVFPFTASET